jgi:hypothetical protein
VQTKYENQSVGSKIESGGRDTHKCIHMHMHTQTTEQMSFSVWEGRLTFNRNTLIMLIIGIPKAVESLSACWFQFPGGAVIFLFAAMSRLAHGFTWPLVMLVFVVGAFLGCEWLEREYD